MPIALIVGVTGQDGSYLAEFLLSKGYRVVGLVRRSSTEKFDRITHLMDKMELAEGDVLDQLSLIDALETIQPDEVYNLAAQSFVPRSWAEPTLTSEINALGVTRILEAIRHVNRKIKYYQASSSEMFGKVRETPQSETTPFHPRSPYGVAKVYGHYLTVNYRESYGLFACSGILFNHESPRRGFEFVTRKISHGVAKIVAGQAKDLRLGNVDAVRDWGFAGDYVDAMWRMLQQSEADDYVVGTGVAHTVREFCKEAFACVNLNWEQFVRIDPQLKRLAEVEHLIANPTKARTKLGWESRVNFQQLVRMMVEADVHLLESRPKSPSR